MLDYNPKYGHGLRHFAAQTYPEFTEVPPTPGDHTSFFNHPSPTDGLNTALVHVVRQIMCQVSILALLITLLSSTDCRDKRNDCKTLINKRYPEYYCRIYKGECDVTCGVDPCLGEKTVTQNKHIYFSVKPFHKCHVKSH